MGYIFQLFLCVLCSFSLDARYCEFCLFRYWVFLYYYKYSWASFWNIVRLLGNSLILLGLAFVIFRQGPYQCLMLIMPHQWGKTFQSTLLNGSRITRFSRLAVGHRQYPMPSVSFEYRSLKSSASRSFLIWRGDGRSPEFSLCVALSSPVFCPVNSSFLGLQRFWAVSSTQSFCQVTSRSAPAPFLAQDMENSLKAVSWGNYGAHFLCLPPLRNHCPCCLMSSALYETL